MTTQQATPEDRARDYIDSIVAINRSYGMGDNLPDEVYNRLVNEALNVFGGLQGRRG